MNQFMEHIKNTGGANCPCCGQFAKIYKRRLYASIAFGIVMLHRLSRHNFGSYHHIGKIMNGYGKTGGGDFAKAKYWGLIEHKENTDDEKRCSGMWRLTEKGRAFAECSLKVPAYCAVYNGEALGFEGEAINVRQALQSKFNYVELMQEK